MRRDSGRWSTSTRSTYSTRHPPPSAPSWGRARNGSRAPRADRSSSWARSASRSIRKHGSGINVSGHRLGTAEVESALVAHPKVSEAAVVGYPHDIKGQGIYCYVTLMAGEQGSEELRKDLVAHVRKEIGPLASPDKIQFAPGLPKTRSGKIMRRILRKIAEDEFGNLGDTSTLADPAVVSDLVKNRQNKKGA